MNKSVKKTNYKQSLWKKCISIVLTMVMIIVLVPIIPYQKSNVEAAKASDEEKLRDLVVKTAKGEIGYCEKNSAYNLYGKDVGHGNYTKYAKEINVNQAEWCAIFVSWCMRKSNVPTSIYASGVVADACYVRSGVFYNRSQASKVKKGDIVLFDLNNNDSPDHVGIVEYDIGQSDTVTAIDGNCSDKVKEESMPIYFRGKGHKVWGFIHIDYSGKMGLPELPNGFTNGYGYSGGGNISNLSPNPDAHSVPTSNLYLNSRGDGVAWVQSICNRLIGTSLSIDGQYGAQTRNAVVTFQRKYGLGADGIVGPQTVKKMNELWNATKVVNPTSISISATDLNVTIGYNEQLSSSVEPSNATDKSVRWSTSNSSVATVDNGVITGHSSGDATITASTSNGKTASCKVHVYKENVIKFVDYDGSILSEQKVKYGGSANAPENPKRTGYTFTTWDGTYQNVRQNAEVKAIYTKDVYKVTFMETNGTKIGSTQKVEYEGAATAPDKSKLNIPDGYTFEGWSENFDVITSDMTIYPVYKWADEELSLVITADENSCIANTDEGTYTLNFTISNHSETKKKARVMTYMVTDSGKMVAQGETRTVKIPAAKNGKDGILEISDMYVVCDKAADKVRILVLDDYASAVPLAEIKDIKVAASGYTEWSEDVPVGDKKYQTRTLYRSKKVNYTTSSSSSLAGWKKYDQTSKTTYSGAGDSKWFGQGGSSSAPWNDNAVRTWAVAKARVQYYPGNFTYPQQTISIKTYGGDYYKSQVKWIQTCLCRLGYYTSVDGVFGSNTVAVLKSFQANNGLSADGIAGSQTNAKLAQLVEQQYNSDYDYYYETKIANTNYTYYFYQEDSNWSEWQENAIEGDEKLNIGTTNILVERKSEYRYKVDLPEAVDSGNVLTPTCKLPDEAIGLAGKEAVVIVFKNKVNQISEDNVEYIGDTVIGANGKLNISFVPREEQSYEGTGDYTIVLGVKGTSNYVKVGTIEAQKPVYNVTFVDDKGKAIAYEGKLTVQEVVEGEKAIVPKAPEKAGYRFIGWDMGATNIHADTTITAQYIKDTYIVTYVDWENRKIETKNVEYDDYLTFPEANPEPPEGLEFKGWKVDGKVIEVVSAKDADNEKTDKKEETVSEGIQVKSNMLCEAVYEVPTFKVTFVDVKGEVIDEQTVEYGSAAMAPAVVPTKKEVEESIEGIPDTNVEDIVTYEDFAESSDCTAVPVHVDNMTFLSWGEDIDLNNITTNIVVGAIYEYDETVAYPYATVTTGEYNKAQTIELKSDTEGAIIYYTTDGSDPTNVEHPEKVKVYDGPITISDKTILTFYACKMGMNDSEVVKEWYSINKTGNTPTHIMRIIPINMFDETIISEYKGFAEDSSLINAYDLLPDDFETIELEGIYYDEELIDQWQQGAETITESQILYAKYVAKQFDVTYLDENGNEIKTDKVSYGNAADTNIAPEKQGYRFTGWISETDGDVNSVTGDMTVRASYVEADRYAEIKFARKSYSIMEGSVYKLTPKMTYASSGEKALDEEIIWSVSDTNYADVDSEGNLNALMKGEITVYAKVVSSGETASCQIKITGNPETSICLLSNSSYKLNDGYLRDIEIGKNTVADVKKQINSDNLKFLDCDSINLNDKDFVGTNTRIQMMDSQGALLDEVIVIQTGDFNGDGILNGKDVSGIIRCLIGKENVDEVTLRALDLNGDGNVNNRDAAMLSRYLVGKEEI